MCVCVCVHVCVLVKLPGLRCSMKICSEQPLSARRGWIRGKLFGGRGHNPICLFTLQQSQIRTIDTLGLVLESKYGSQRERRGGEEDYILQRSAPRVNLPHGPLHRAQYETMIKKKLLYSLSYQYNSVSVARRLILVAGIFCYHEFSVAKKPALVKVHSTFRDKCAPGERCLTQFEKPWRAVTSKSFRLEHVIGACSDKGNKLGKYNVLK